MSEEIDVTPSKVQVGYGETGVSIQEFDQAWKFCRAYALGTLPQNANDHEVKQKTAELLVRFQHGRELGFPPGAALQVIYVVKGRPAIEGSGVMALCRSARHRDKFIVLPHTGCDVIEVPGEEPDLIGWCEFHRKGEPPTRTEFTLGEAARLGLTKKSDPWRAVPRQMLQYRALARAGKLYLSDIMLGVDVYETVRDHDYPPAERIASVNVAPQVAELAPAKADPLLAALKGQPEETLIEAVKRIHPEGEIAKIAEHLSTENPILADLHQPGDHKATVAAAIEGFLEKGEPGRPAQASLPIAAPVTCPECNVQTESPDQEACTSCGIVFDAYLHPERA